MSKHKPANPPADPAPPAPRPITPDSSLVDVLRAEAATHREIMRRESFQRLKKLQAQLDALPPPPEHYQPFSFDD